MGDGKAEHQAVSDVPKFTRTGNLTVTRPEKDFAAVLNIFKQQKNAPQFVGLTQNRLYVYDKTPTSSEDKCVNMWDLVNIFVVAVDESTWEFSTLVGVEPIVFRDPFGSNAEDWVRDINERSHTATYQRLESDDDVKAKPEFPGVYLKPEPGILAQKVFYFTSKKEAIVEVVAYMGPHQSKVQKFDKFSTKQDSSLGRLITSRDQSKPEGKLCFLAVTDQDFPITLKLLLRYKRKGPATLFCVARWYGDEDKMFVHRHIGVKGEAVPAFGMFFSETSAESLKLETIQDLTLEESMQIKSQDIVFQAKQRLAELQKQRKELTESIAKSQKKRQEKQKQHQEALAQQQEEAKRKLLEIKKKYTMVPECLSAAPDSDDAYETDPLQVFVLNQTKVDNAELEKQLYKSLERFNFEGRLQLVLEDVDDVSPKDIGAILVVHAASADPNTTTAQAAAVATQLCVPQHMVGALALPGEAGASQYPTETVVAQWTPTLEGWAPRQVAVLDKLNPTAPLGNVVEFFKIVVAANVLTQVVFEF